MPEAGHPADVLVADLLDTFAASHRRLEGIVAAGLRRGLNPDRLGTFDQQRGDATLAYRARQLEQARAITGELERQAGTVAPIIVGRAYRSGLVAVDRTVGAGRTITGQFGRVHVRAVEALSGNLTASLEAAARRAGENVATVFDRASVLEGALPASRRIAGVSFLGRRANDPYRELALRTLAEGQVTLDTRRQMSAELARRLVLEGVTDATTGFVDRSGRRWSLEHYAAMVATTTTREAVSTATAARMLEHGVGLVAISSHEHRADVCTPYDGRTFALPGTAEADEGRHPVIDHLPPFHPRCGHVAHPAAASYDEWEAELRRDLGLDAPAAPGPSSRSLPPSARELSPAPDDVTGGLSPEARPRHDDRTPERLEQQRVAELIAGDPGPDVDWWDVMEETDRAAMRTAAKSRRQANRALNESLGPDLAKFIDRKWGREERVRERLLAGELTIDDATNLAIDESERLERRAAEREVNKSLRGYTERVRCFQCGQFKRRPSDVCDHCGDDPVPRGTEPNDFDRGYGYDVGDAVSRSSTGYQVDPFGRQQR